MNKAHAMRLVDAASAEASRGQRYLGRKRPRAYYISHLVRDEEIWRVEGRFGALFGRRHNRERSCFTDVRVGSYRYDHVQDGGLNDNSKEDESYNYVDFPVGNQPDGIRHAFWKLTDARYREAVDAYMRKRADELTYVNRYRHLPSFEKRQPVVDARFQRLAPVDLDYWSDYVRRTSAVTKRAPRVKLASVLFEAAHVTRVFANSEGSRIIDRSSYWVLECSLWLLSRRGDGIPWTVQHYTADPAELPSRPYFVNEILSTVKLLEELSCAKTVRSFSGPVLLEPKPAGLLMHEALGHRLEGNRLLSQGEGQTFGDSVGRRILPEFLSVYDDASLSKLEQRSLVGHYRYDDEGVPAQRAALIERGVLRGFLKSRAGISQRHASNGHGRSARHERPISRMAVTVVRSHEGLSEEQLFERFIEEIRRQRVPFGMRVVHANGGETATDGYNFQAFLGEINLLSRVYPDGRQEWVRGLNFVGTPLNAVRSIVAAGARYDVDNAHCGAESGYVPVSTVSPALVVSRLELQSKSEPRYAQYTYPIPWGR